MFANVVSGLDWAAHLADVQSSIEAGGSPYSGPGFEVTDGVAEFRLSGVLSKHGTSLSRDGSTIRFREVCRNIESAKEDGRVRSAILRVESGGGATMGTPEAAEAMARLASVMPVTAYCEDLCASAAYWIASQATTVVCNSSALIGSIGTYMSIDDVSEMFRAKGIDTNLFTTGAHKGAGTYGTRLTDAQKAEFQSLTQRINAPFFAAVKDARELTDDQLSAVNDGRVWRGQEAVDSGLVDGVMTYEEALADLAGTNSTSANPKGTQPMASNKTDAKSSRIKAKSEDMKDEEDTSAEDDEVEETESEDEEEEQATESKAKPRSKSKAPATTIAALRAAVPDADSDFLLNAYESGMTPADAKSAWMEQTIKAQQAQIDELKSQRPGVKALGTGKSSARHGGPDHAAAIRAEVKALTDEGMPRHKAMAKVLSDNPEYRQAMVASANA